MLSSPYKRAVDTIKLYADKSSLQIEKVFELRERTVDSCWIEDFKGFSKKSGLISITNYRMAKVFMKFRIGTLQL